MDLHLPTPAGELTRAEQKILDYINTNTDAMLSCSPPSGNWPSGWSSPMPRFPVSPAMWAAGTSRR